MLILQRYIFFYLLTSLFFLSHAQLQIGLDRDPYGQGNASYAIGEAVSIQVLSSFSGYLYLFNIDRNHQMTLLLPSPNESTNYIRAGIAESFPRNRLFNYTVNGPIGTEQVIGLLSSQALDNYTLNQILTLGQSSISVQGTGLSEQAMWVWDSLTFNVISAPTWLNPTNTIPTFGQNFPSSPQPSNNPNHSEGMIDANFNYIDGGATGYSTANINPIIDSLSFVEPNNSYNFSLRKTPKSIDGGFESAAAFNDLLNHFVLQLYHQGFIYEQQLASSFNNSFEGVFSFNGQKITLSFFQSGSFFRFEIYYLA
ncbi:MAG: DUF4384 domain-containing protein [Deinococcales bacterium]